MTNTDHSANVNCYMSSTLFLVLQLYATAKHQSLDRLKLSTYGNLHFCLNG